MSSIRLFLMLVGALGFTSATAAEKEPPKLLPITPVGPGLHLSRLFNDHMVLQRERPVKIWGWADAGDAVAVNFAGQTKTTKAGADGRWIVQLKPMLASAEGRELVVRSGASQVTIRDVLVGEVWLLGGQSNMSFPLWVRRDGFKKADAETHPEYRAIRCVSTLHGDFADPPYHKLDWIHKEPQKELPFKREWVVFGPKCLDLHAPPFSAFGFFFAKNLYDQLKVPVGLVDTSVGGALAHYWAPGEEQRNIPELAPFFAEPIWTPGCLYNSTIWPIRDLAFRGAWFYLGENNSMTKPVSIFEPTYRAVLASWRRTFGQLDLPFGIVQIAIRGHVMIWPSWDNTPPFLRRDESLPLCHGRQPQCPAHLEAQPQRRWLPDSFWHGAGQAVPSHPALRRDERRAHPPCTQSRRELLLARGRFPCRRFDARLSIASELKP